MKAVGAVGFRFSTGPASRLSPEATDFAKRDPDHHDLCEFACANPSVRWQTTEGET